MASGGGDQLDNEELRRVNADLRDIYSELFMGDDSDEEFEGFTLSDINDNKMHSERAKRSTLSDQSLK